MVLSIHLPHPFQVSTQGRVRLSQPDPVLYLHSIPLPAAQIRVYKLSERRDTLLVPPPKEQVPAPKCPAPAFKVLLVQAEVGLTPSKDYVELSREEMPPCLVYVSGGDQSAFTH